MLSPRVVTSWACLLVLIPGKATRIFHFATGLNSGHAVQNQVYLATDIFGIPDQVYQLLVVLFKAEISRAAALRRLSAGGEDQQE